MPDGLLMLRNCFLDFAADPAYGTSRTADICERKVKVLSNITPRFRADYLQLLLSLVISIIAIHFCMVSQALTSPNVNVCRIDLPTLCDKSPPFTRSVLLLCSLHWLPVRFRILIKINLLTYKTLFEKSLFIFTPSLPHHSHPVY